jgi:hypothetical protein
MSMFGRSPHEYGQQRYLPNPDKLGYEAIPRSRTLAPRHLPGAVRCPESYDTRQPRFPEEACWKLLIPLAHIKLYVCEEFAVLFLFLFLMLCFLFRYALIVRH